MERVSSCTMRDKRRKEKLKDEDKMGRGGAGEMDDVSVTAAMEWK